jgi:hypothetical protein
MKWRNIAADSSSEQRAELCLLFWLLVQLTLIGPPNLAYDFLKTHQMVDALLGADLEEWATP